MTDAAHPSDYSTLDDLSELDLDDLRKHWRSRFGPPPSIRSVELLAMMLAWRIQAEHEGGMETDARRSLRRPTASPGLTALTPGTLLTREWKGVRHKVTVEGDGRLRWGETTYGSLSEVARAITGSRWNGPRFFGLREGDMA